MSNPRSLIAINWRALALKRLAHFDEMKRTGRWRQHFKSEEAFIEAFKAVVADAARWKEIAYRSDAPMGEAAE